jgi:hypothetical protein
MKAKVNEKLVATILKKIPPNIKPVAYLTNVLKISRESAYRRIRSSIPFSMEELAILSSLLEFSIDNIIEENNFGRASFNFYTMEKGPVNLYLSMLYRYNELLENMLNAKATDSIMALNHFPPIYQVFFDKLFKFTYYKWLHQSGELSFNLNFADVTLSEELSAIQKKILMNIRKLNNHVLILGPTTFLSLTQDIQYYYQRRLINENELNLLKDDLIKLIALFENIARTGSLGQEAKIYLYLSSLYVNANTGYFHYDNMVETLIWIFATNPIIIYNSNISTIQKDWLLSLKRQSTLISQSNEILQMEFFDQQRKYVDRI